MEKEMGESLARSQILFREVQKTENEIMTNLQTIETAYLIIFFVKTAKKLWPSTNYMCGATPEEVRSARHQNENDINRLGGLIGKPADYVRFASDK
ncbi:hypothetical protein ACFSQ3_07960 [Sphingobacterium corticis]|uniref:Uncharacterized protein n=1 Tax=Sphingobacterium corticis TaxID=1812823 RepID=A0ABW5NJL1_9SPHI